MLIHEIILGLKTEAIIIDDYRLQVGLFLVNITFQVHNIYKISPTQHRQVET